MNARILLCLVFACGPASSPPVVTSPTPPAPTPTAAEPLALAVRMIGERDERKWSIAQDGKVKSGDYVELFITVNQPAYVYVVQFQPDGSASVLFPPKGDRLVQPGAEQKVLEGADDVLQFDTTVGREHIFVVMSRQPIGALDAALGTQITEIRAATLATPPVPEPTPPTPPDPTPPPTAKPPPPRVSSAGSPKRKDAFHNALVARGGFKARALAVVKRPGAPVKVEANTTDDPLVVVDYTLEHE